MFNRSRNAPSNHRTGFILSIYNLLYQRVPLFLNLGITTPHEQSEIHVGLDWIEKDWNALIYVDKITEKNQINECIIQVLAHINRYA